jgi:Superinfection immunity protein
MNALTLAQYNTFPAGDPSQQMAVNIIGAVFLFVLACFVLVVYFTPTIIAYWRDYHAKIAIFWINLLLGWTLVVWLILVLVAMEGKTKNGNVYEVRLVREGLEKKLKELEEK